MNHIWSFGYAIVDFVIIYTVCNIDFFIFGYLIMPFLKLDNVDMYLDNTDIYMDN